MGIKSEPGENQDWFCTRCVAKKQVNIEEDFNNWKEGLVNKFAMDAFGQEALPIDDKENLFFEAKHDVSPIFAVNPETPQIAGNFDKCPLVKS